MLRPDAGSLFQVVIDERESLFLELLPGVGLEVDVGACLVRVGLHHRLSGRHAGEPALQSLVVTPVPVIQLYGSHQLYLVLRHAIEDIEQGLLAEAVQSRTQQIANLSADLL